MGNNCVQRIVIFAEIRLTLIITGMKKIIRLLFLSCIAVLCLCQCNETDTKRVYVRDIFPGVTTQTYNLKQDVESLTEDAYYYNESWPEISDLTDDGKIKRYGKYGIREILKFDRDGKEYMDSWYKMNRDDRSLTDSYRKYMFDDKGREILYEGYSYNSDGVSRKKVTSGYSHIYEDEESATYRTSTYLNEDGTRNSSPRSLLAKYEYDKNHRIVKEYAADGKLRVEWRETRDYEEKITYDTDNGSGISSKKYYDNHGRLTESWEMNEKGELSRKRYVYNDEDLTRTCYDDELGTVEIIYYWYPDYKQVVKKVVKASDGSVKEETTYQYDGHGSQTGVLWLLKSYSSYKSYSYEYDNKGNWIIKKTFYDDELQSVIVRHIMYYDGYDSDSRLSEIMNEYVAAPARRGQTQSSGSSSSSSSWSSWGSSGTYNPSSTFMEYNNPPVSPSVMEPSPHELTQYGYVDTDCSLCHHSGKCPTCNGNGWYFSAFSSDRLDCPNCNHGECSRCGGTGTIQVFRGL